MIGVIGAIATITGICITAYFINENNIKQKIREIRMNHLIETYRNLSLIVHRNPNDEIKIKLENAINDMQFLGSKKEIDAINDFLKNYKDGGDLMPALVAIRNDLRKELKLEDIISPIKFFRYH